MKGFLILSAILAALLGWGFHAVHQTTATWSVTR